MPAPTTYSEAQLQNYVASVLGELAGILGWDAGSVQVIEAVNDALLELGVASIAAATTPKQIRGLRALGRRAIWRAVVQATAGKYNFSDSGAAFTRSQIQAMALEALALAENDCLEFSPTYAVTILAVKRPHDPYQVIPDSERLP